MKGGDKGDVKRYMVQGQIRTWVFCSQYTTELYGGSAREHFNEENIIRPSVDHKALKNITDVSTLVLIPPVQTIHTLQIIALQYLTCFHFPQEIIVVSKHFTLQWSNHSQKKCLCFDHLKRFTGQYSWPPWHCGWLKGPLSCCVQLPAWLEVPS